MASKALRPDQNLVKKLILWGQAWELGKVSGAHRDDCSAVVVEDLYGLAFPHSTFKHYQRQPKTKAIKMWLTNSILNTSLKLILYALIPSSISTTRKVDESVNYSLPYKIL